AHRRDLGLQVPAGGVGLGLGLVDSRDCLRDRGNVEIVGGLLGVVVLLRHDAVFVKGLGSIPVKLLLLQVCLGMSLISLGGLFGGNVGGDVGFGSGDCGLLAVDA